MTPTADSFAEAPFANSGGAHSEGAHSDGAPSDGAPSAGAHPTESPSADATPAVPAFADLAPALLGETTPLPLLAQAVRHRTARLADDPGAVARLGPLPEAASLLWTRHHKFDAADPRWPDRDRMVFAGPGGALLHDALLDLSGHDAPGSGEPHPGVEAAPGPLGQGLGHAAGLALAERLLAARFGRSLVDHRTWLVAGEGDFGCGISHEAASLAGELRLTKLTVLWHAAARGAADVLRRFALYGWAVRQVDGRSAAELAAALAMAVRSGKPTLLACRGDDRGTAGEAGPDEPPPAPDREAAWHAAGGRGSGARRAWLKRLARHALRGEFERVMAGRPPDGLHEALAGLRAAFAASRPALATRAASQSVLAAVAPTLPELVGGSPRRVLPGIGHGDRPDAAAWRPQPHGMAAALNGLALHGGLIPYGGAFLPFSDAARPALRLAAAMRQRVIHVLLRDGGDRPGDDRPGDDDDPAADRAEQLAALRALPNVLVFRPADAIETAECWEAALRRADGPTVLALSRQPVPSLRPPGPAGENRAARGGYVLAEAETSRHATIVATGPEVATAMAARETLRDEGIRVAVVSLPCWELFERQPAAEQQAVLGAAPRIGVEAGSAFGWTRWLGPDGLFVGQGTGCDAQTLDGRALDGRALDGRALDARSLNTPAPSRPSAAAVAAAVRASQRPR